MTSALIQRCRTCRPEERRDIALELARIGDEESITELITMVEAGVRVARPIETRYRDVPYRPHWWSKEEVRHEPYQVDSSDHYDYQDQLIGIQAMGSTGNAKCLAYLCDLWTPDFIVENVQLQNEVNFAGSATQTGTAIVTFLNARGELANMMQYSRPVGGVDGCGPGGGGSIEWEGLDAKGHSEYCRVILASRDPHKTIMEAISRLEGKMRNQ